MYEIKMRIFLTPILAGTLVRASFLLRWFYSGYISFVYFIIFIMQHIVQYIYCTICCVI